MKKIKLIIIFAFISSLSFVSCDKDFEELNKDPNNSTNISAHLLLPGIVRSAQNRNYSTFVGGELAGWAGQLAKVQYNDQQRYVFRQSVITGIWDTYYGSVISDANAMFNLANDEGNNNIKGTALVLQAYGYSVLTEIFGYIPFSEALKAGEGNFSPAYDTQEEVYDGVISLLDEAMSLLGTGGTIDSTSDILYGGDDAKWIKFAASLKFRILMRISAKRGVSAELQALASSGKLFSSNDDEAKLVYLTSAPSANPLYESIVFGTRGEYKMNEVLVDMLANTGDPRLPIYAQLNDAGVYRGKPSGIEGLPNNDYNYTNVSAIGTFYLRPEAPGYFMSNAELHFLMAEAAQKGYIGGSAQAHYNMGLDASFAFNGLSQADADAFKASNGIPLSIIPAQALEQIGNQLWISIFTQGVEAWTEQRRTGFPVLPPAIDGLFNEIPSRLSYPTSESSLNGASRDAAIAAQGADVLTTKLWFMN